MEKQLIMPAKALNINSPQELGKFATTLKKFIVEQKLYTNIAGKNYVQVEGWQFAGASTGVFPVMREVFDVSKDNEIKYRAEVELVNANGQTLGYGVAICSNKEANKKTFDEYAIASMAQTRAVGKAYRNLFAWLMKVAGYEPLPAEEAKVEAKAEDKEETEKGKGLPTDNQLATIEKLAKGKKVKKPATFEEAAQLIKELAV